MTSDAHTVRTIAAVIHDTKARMRMAGVRLLLMMVLLSCTAALNAAEPARVFAAASLTQAMDEIAADWQRDGHPAPVIAYGGTSALARQIEAGAPADLFVSADRRWMDHVQQAERIDPDSRIDLLRNRLVLIAPKGRGFAITLSGRVDLAAAFEGKLCTGEPDVVPVGTYAKQALTSLQAWDGIASRVVGTDDVRAALAFVERGECAAGIVYATDAQASGMVDVVAEFPAGTHESIIYPVALIRGARPEARALLRHLRDSPEASAAFARHGFQRITP